MNLLNMTRNQVEELYRNQTITMNEKTYTVVTPRTSAIPFIFTDGKRYYEATMTVQKTAHGFSFSFDKDAVEVETTIAPAYGWAIVE